MKLGIGTYTYMWSVGFPGAEPPVPMTAMELLCKARELDIDVVQYGPNLPLAELAESDLGILLDRAHEWGIELEVGMRGFDLNDVRRQIALCRRAGATLLRTVSAYDLRDPIPTEAELRTMLACLIPDLAEAGVCLAIENATIPAALLAKVIGDLASPWLGITLDTVNSLAIPEGTEQVARTLAPHVRCLHVKDFVVERVWHLMGFTVEGRPAGQGQLNVPWLLDLLDQESVSANAILELWVPRRSTLEEAIALEQSWALESIEYLRKFIPPQTRHQGDPHVR